jgi:hypothetical protein
VDHTQLLSCADMLSRACSGHSELAASKLSRKRRTLACSQVEQMLQTLGDTLRKAVADMTAQAADSQECACMTLIHGQ